MRALSLAWLSALALGCAAAAPRTAQPAAPQVRPGSAASLVRAMLERYQTARTYEDRGTSVAFLHADEPERADRSTVTFRTAFDRASGRFLFDYAKSHGGAGNPTRGVIWREAEGDARSWATFRPTIEEMDAERAIVGLTGVSGGTAWNVPAMLFGIGSIWDRGPAARLADLPLGAERTEALRGTTCLKVSARRGENEVSVWIGTNDHAVHRIFERSRIVPKPRSAGEILASLPADLPDDVKIAVLQAHEQARPFLAEQTIDYEPVFDRAIEESRFRFVPPADEASEVVSRSDPSRAPWPDRAAAPPLPR
jgi:hypothetical protein